jgi:hypothetical protein
MSYSATLKGKKLVARKAYVILTQTDHEGRCRSATHTAMCVEQLRAGLHLFDLDEYGEEITVKMYLNYQYVSWGWL